MALTCIFFNDNMSAVSWNLYIPVLREREVPPHPPQQLQLQRRRLPQGVPLRVQAVIGGDRSGQLSLELQTKIPDDYAKFYIHGEGPYTTRRKIGTLAQKS